MVGGIGAVSRVEGGGPREGLGPSSEAGTRPRGAPRPRAKRELARGGATPSSEAGVSGAVSAPRATQRFARGVLGLAV
jgi:hypothetical protein